MKKNLSSDFKRNSVIICVVALVLAVTTSMTVYFLNKQARKNTYVEIADQFDGILIYDFTHTERDATIFSRKILQEKDKSLKKLALLMSENFTLNENNIFSWTYFDWVNDKSQLVVNSKQGVLYSPINLAGREYIEKSKKQPWKLVIGKPSIGKPSGEYVIPAGLSVEDRDGKYVGTLAVEFSVKKMRDKLLDIASDLHYEFFIIDDDDDILLSSQELNNIGNDFFKHRKFTVSKGLLHETISYNNNIEIDYAYESKYYPFRILLGKNNKQIFIEFIKSILPKILAIILVASVSIYLLMSLRNKILAPLARLSYVANTPGDEGAKKISLTSKYSEITQLASGISQIQNFNERLKDEVMKRTMHLQEALKSKQEFLNNISHEVRTPLQGILGISIELHKRWDKIQDNDKRNYIRIMAESSDRLMQLMSNILDLSRLEKEKAFFKFRVCEFRNIIKDSVKQIRPLFESNKKLSLKIHYDEQIITKIKCDRLKMQQVLNNLISNAVKYSADGEIKISVTNKGNNIQVAVSDEGIGIPKKEKESIFQPFVESSKTKTKAGGKGLGLALCKEIISAHQGKIWAANKKKGSIFYFTIPI